MADLINSADIAVALGISKRGVELKAARESWSYHEVAVRGGKKRLFPLATLPADIRLALQKQAISAALPVIAKEIAAPVMTRADDPSLTGDQVLGRNARAGVLAALRRCGACRPRPGVVRKPP